MIILAVLLLANLVFQGKYMKLNIFLANICSFINILFKCLWIFSTYLFLGALLMFIKELTIVAIYSRMYFAPGDFFAQWLIPVL